MYMLRASIHIVLAIFTQDEYCGMLARIAFENGLDESKKPSGKEAAEQEAARVATGAGRLGANRGRVEELACSTSATASSAEQGSSAFCMSGNFYLCDMESEKLLDGACSHLMRSRRCTRTTTSARAATTTPSPR